ncbi:hypothetical protein IWX47DRAFT_872060 [Phyllosticta citricarpa]
MDGVDGRTDGRTDAGVREPPESTFLPLLCMYISSIYYFCIVPPRNQIAGHKSSSLGPRCLLILLIAVFFPIKSTLLCVHIYGMCDAMYVRTYAFIMGGWTSVRRTGYVL